MKRTLILSDIHGNYKKFEMMLQMINYDPLEDKLIILGDLMDRGQQNLNCLYKAMELQKQGAIILKGNHEKMAEDTLKTMMLNNKTYSSLHMRNGGGSTISEFKELNNQQLNEIYKFIKYLPLKYEIDDYIFVHAGVNADVPIEQNEEFDFLWSREEFIYRSAYKNKTVVFGHTPVFYMNTKYNNGMIDIDTIKIWHSSDKIGIDCGCVYGGKLACLELPSKKEYYI